MKNVEKIARTQTAYLQQKSLANFVSNDFRDIIIMWVLVDSRKVIKQNEKYIINGSSFQVKKTVYIIKQIGNYWYLWSLYHFVDICS